MNNGGDAAEQVVRLSLEGFEVAAKLTGSAATNVALLLVSVLKQEQQTKGKARLTNMIKSGKELKVFSIPNKDLAQFTKQAKRYGVLYCVLRDKSAKGDDVPVDIIARAEDASKIQRIVERLEGAVIVLSCIIFSLFASSPPVVNPDAAAVTQVWSYVGELLFNMLVLVGSVKMSDRIIREMMGL